MYTIHVLLEVSFAVHKNYSRRRGDYAAKLN